MASTELLMITAIVSLIILGLVIVVATRKPSILRMKESNPENEKKEEETPQATIPSQAPPHPVYTSVSKDDVQTAEENLRILSVEKEIVSYALTRLYEAQAEGKITEKDKEKLLGKYKDEMIILEKRISDKQMVVRLHELETTQADLVKLFQEKFDEINRNIDSIRTNLGLVPQPVSEPEAKTETPPKDKPKDTTSETPEEQKEKQPPKPRTPKKSEAEEKVEAIQAEVLKILERLEKQEAEG